MITKEAQSLGGQKMASVQKEEAKNRIDEYNKNPNLCMCCKKPIIAPYDKKLRETKIKKFCSKSCAAHFNNLGKVKNKTGFSGKNNFIDNFTDDEIKEIFLNSNSITDFGTRLGYKNKIGSKNKSINDRLQKIGLNIEILRNTNDSKVLNYTKKELFDKYEQWQTARSAIQRYARNICEKSNKPKKCLICGYDKHYEVAHIKAVSLFEDNVLISEINDIENLVALCPNHHWEYDNGILELEEYLN